MLSFLCAIWDIADAQAGLIAGNVRTRLSNQRRPRMPRLEYPGLIAFIDGEHAQGDHVHELANDSGFAIGTIFRRNDSPSCRVENGSSLSSQEMTSRLSSTRGRSMIHDYWGSYVLFLRSSLSGRSYVLRGPMSSMPCFHTKFTRINFFYSSVEDFASLRIVPLSINWDCIRAQASSYDYLTQETGLREVSSIDCGECVELGAGLIASHSYWSPLSVVGPADITDFADATTQLRVRTQSSIDAWASCHNRILHTLSGGLDSSIVLSCLRRAPNEPEVDCITSYFDDQLSDERSFARAMAQRCSVKLIERRRQEKPDLKIFLDCARTARPVLSFTAFDTYQPNVQLAQERNATAIFNGELGDNVFGSVAGHESVTEYLWRNGFRTPGLQVAMHFAQLRGISIWTVVYKALRDHLFCRSSEYWNAYGYARHMHNLDAASHGLLSAAALRTYEHTRDRFIHPWLKHANDMPPGKFLLVYGLLVMTSTSYHLPFAKSGDPPIVAPLASQPLVEEALRIASYLNMDGGRNRAVARHAFSDDLPPLILNRHGKGNSSQWIRDVVASNRILLRELLHEGVLVRERILDARKLESLLSGEVTNSQSAVIEIVEQLYIECWLRRWDADALRAT